MEDGVAKPPQTVPVLVDDAVNPRLADLQALPPLRDDEQIGEPVKGEGDELLLSLLTLEKLSLKVLAMLTHEVARREIEDEE